MKYALHFGLNYLSYKIDYDRIISKSSVANMCYFDKLAKDKGFISETYPNDKATSLNLISKLKELSMILQKGDLLFITYCGHGLSISSEDENDNSEEALVLYDRIFFDKEFLNCVKLLKKGVFIFIITNSCENGTLIDNDIE
jgi:hypothetical protein